VPRVRAKDVELLFSPANEFAATTAKSAFADWFSTCGAVYSPGGRLYSPQPFRGVGFQPPVDAFAPSQGEPVHSHQHPSVIPGGGQHFPVQVGRGARVVCAEGKYLADAVRSTHIGDIVTIWTMPKKGGIFTASERS
jgi:hypothetical protein